MTHPTAVPINLFENDSELVLITPMPGVTAEDISVDVMDDGHLIVRARMHGEGQERRQYLIREWSYGPFERTVQLPVPVDARRANLSFGNGVLAVALPKADVTAPAALAVQPTGHARGLTEGHSGDPRRTELA